MNPKNGSSEFPLLRLGLGGYSRAFVHEWNHKPVGQLLVENREAIVSAAEDLGIRLDSGFDDVSSSMTTLPQQSMPSQLGLTRVYPRSRENFSMQTSFWLRSSLGSRIHDATLPWSA